MEAIAEKFITPEEYLALETDSPIKHEYFNGQIYAMAGGTPCHNKIIFNCNVALGSRLQGKNCIGANSDQRVKIESNGLNTYPDVLIVCAPERYAENDANALLNPCVIVEVLSPSTERYDRTDKFDLYQQISALTDYLLVAQDRVRVDHFHRDGENWTVRSYYEREDSLHLADLDLKVPLAEIYHRLDLPSGLIVLPVQTNDEDLTNRF